MARRPLNAVLRANDQCLPFFSVVVAVLNIGVSKQAFQALFGTSNVDISIYDFTALDTIMPHPDYATQSWLCVFNPSDTTFETVQPFLAEAYERAVKRDTRQRTRA